MKNIVFITGAGVSAESGLSTFRDSDGLWNNYSVDEVATYEALVKNPSFVNDFYNARRKDVMMAIPNQAHLLIAKLQENFNVNGVTTNVDDLHERAGSSNVLHLHGNIMYAKSSNSYYDWNGLDNPEEKLYLIDRDLDYNKDIADDGFSLRPQVVLFGEPVIEITNAIDIVKSADIVVVVGTSLQVYPAASLIYDSKKEALIYYIDPNPADVFMDNKVVNIKEKATVGMSELYEMLIKEV